VYELETDPEAVGDLQGLPGSALIPYAEVLSLLEVAPWSGQAYNRQRPDGNMRSCRSVRTARASSCT